MIFIFQKGKTICIPKEDSKEIHYRAHPYGLACQCHTKADDTKILEELQQGKLSSETECSIYTKTPQFRIFTPKMTQRHGVKIHLIPSDVTYMKTIKERISLIVKEIHSIARKRIVLPSRINIAFIEKCKQITWYYLGYNRKSHNVFPYLNIDSSKFGTVSLLSPKFI